MAQRSATLRYARANSLALLKLLALGNREIEQGKFQDAQSVFASIDAADLP